MEYCDRWEMYRWCCQIPPNSNLFSIFLFHAWLRLLIHGIYFCFSVVNKKKIFLCILTWKKIMQIFCFSQREVKWRWIEITSVATKFGAGKKINETIFKLKAAFDLLNRVYPFGIWHWRMLEMRLSYKCMCTSHAADEYVKSVRSPWWILDCLHPGETVWTFNLHLFVRGVRF